jgi:hypothetical protein
MLTRYKGQLKLKDWAFAIARRSSMRKARVGVVLQARATPRRGPLFLCRAASASAAGGRLTATQKDIDALSVLTVHDVP